MPDYDNAAIADILDTVGDLLEVVGADKYRFLSYHRAAHAVRAWPEDIATTASDDRLTEIPGVGAKLGAAMTSLLATGSFPELDEVRALLPETITELLLVPGLGPRRVGILHAELGVDSLDALERAAAEGRLTGLPGFGPKTVANITEGIARARRMGERTLLARALRLAERFLAALDELPAVQRAECAGSLRRMKETIGDIDVLVASADPAAVAAGVRALPIVTSVIATGPTKTSVLTTAGLQVDVRVVGVDEWGAALQYFTGSKEHNVKLREIARSRGLKINEYGVFRLEDGARVAGATEQEVYAALGMPAMPPEVREDRGEIELALRGELPELIERGDLRGDLHVHTDATDGSSTLEQVRDAAGALGYEYIGCTDHAFDLRMVGGLSVEELERQWSSIDELNAAGGGPRILKGIELNIGDDSSVDYPAEVLARFDFCIASLHGGWNQPRERVTERVLLAMRNPYVDIIGHPTGRILGQREPFDLDMEAICAAAAETGTALELNCSPDRLDLSDVHLLMARRHGALVAISTDAHEATQLHFARWGIATARRGWIAPVNVLNARPLAEMLAALKRNQITKR